MFEGRQADADGLRLVFAKRHRRVHAGARRQFHASVPGARLHTCQRGRQGELAPLAVRRAQLHHQAGERQVDVLDEAGVQQRLKFRQSISLAGGGWVRTHRHGDSLPAKQASIAWMQAALGRSKKMPLAGSAFAAGSMPRAKR